MVRGEGPHLRQVVKHRLIIAPLAEADITTGFSWYEERSTGLGRDFISRVEAKFAVISLSPQLFHARFGSYRLAATERFPYAIYFIWDEVTGIVTVRRVLHFKQDRAAGL